jgi:RNA polymerase sigma factor (sigma-70 family)
MPEIDASQHLPLINRVINQMGLIGDEAEEAYSESLVTITKAAKKYDPSYNVPVANWLAQNIRFGIQKWRSRQKLYLPISMPIMAQQDISDISITLKETIEQLEILLTPLEKQVILATAIGYTGQEIARALNTYPVAVSRAKKRAREKLKGIRTDANACP